MRVLLHREPQLLQNSLARDQRSIFLEAPPNQRHTNFIKNTRMSYERETSRVLLRSSKRWMEYSVIHESGTNSGGTNVETRIA